MSIINHKQIFYISSENRIAGNHSNFSFKLPQYDRTKNFNQVVVLQAVIPKTYYLVSTGENTFILQENNTPIIILVPIGNYSKTSFRIVIQNLLNQNSLNSFVYSVIDDNTFLGPDTGKFTFKVTNNGISQPTIIMNSELHFQFGFFRNSVNNFVNNVLVSSHFIDFNLENKIYIHSNICQNTTGDNILQEIFTTGVPTASYIKYDCLQLEAYSKFFNANADNYTFYITNERGVQLDLNGVNVEFTIMVYEKTNINEQLSSYIEMEKTKNYLKLNN